MSENQHKVKFEIERKGIRKVLKKNKKILIFLYVLLFATVTGSIFSPYFIIPSIIEIFGIIVTQISTNDKFEEYLKHSKDVIDMGEELLDQLFTPLPSASLVELNVNNNPRAPGGPSMEGTPNSDILFGNLVLHQLVIASRPKADSELSNEGKPDSKQRL